MMNRGWFAVGARKTRKSASPSTVSEVWARRLSKARSEDMCGEF